MMEGDHSTALPARLQRVMSDPAEIEVFEDFKQSKCDSLPELLQEDIRWEKKESSLKIALKTSKSA